jgi:hypothetical protein
MFADELVEEMYEQPEGKVDWYLHRIAGMLAWVATGDEYEGLEFPQDFRYMLDRETTESDDS